MRHWQFLLPVALVQIALLLYGIGVEDLWLDEVMSLEVARGSVEGMVRFFRGLPEQHPLYYLVLRPWVGVLGGSETMVRLPSAIFAAASLFVFFALSRRLLGLTAARVATVLFALSPFVLYLGQEARMYTLLMFLVLANALAFLRWREDRSRGNLAAYLATAILGAYTHVFFLFTLVAQLGYVVVTERGIGRDTWRLVRVQAVVALAFVPWAILIVAGLGSQGWKGLEHVVFGIPYAVFRFTVGYSEFLPNAAWKERVLPLMAENVRVLVLAGSAVAGLGLAGLVHLRRAGREGLFVLCGLLGPMVLALLASLVVVVMGERYLIVSFPFFLMLLAGGIVELAGSRGMRRVAGGVLVGALALVTGESLVAYHLDPDFGKERWSAVSELLRERRRPSDALVLHSGFVERPLRYYYPEVRTAGPLYSSDAVAPEVIRRTPRVWVVISHAPDGEEYLRSVAGESHAVVADTLFPQQSGIRVVLLDADCRVRSGTSSEPAAGVPSCELQPPTGD